MHLVEFLREICSGAHRPLTAGFVCAAIGLQLFVFLSSCEPGGGRFGGPAGRMEAVRALPPPDRLAPRGGPAECCPAPRPPREPRRADAAWPDLIAQIGRSLELPQPADADIAREFYRYAADANSLNRILQRSEPYLHYIVETIERHCMPLDLALLPIVESAYNPYAYSRKQAAGLWQIVPGTGRDLGLTQDAWYDARLDIVESTEAALTYLRELRAQFGGDWLLALAGYNAGGARVAQAARRARAENLPVSFWGIRAWLPEETRTYVPRLLALSRLFREPERFGVALRAVPDRPRFRVVETGGPVDMAQVAEAAGISARDLYLLNPGLNRRMTAPAGPHRLLVPYESAGRAAAVLEDGGGRRPPDGGGIVRKQGSCPAARRRRHGPRGPAGGPGQSNRKVRARNRASRKVEDNQVPARCSSVPET